MDHHAATILWTSITLVGLLLLSGFFSASEMVFTTLDISKYREYAERKGKINLSSKVTILLLRNYSTTLNTILVGNNLANIAGATISGILFTEIFGDAGLGVATGLMTLFVLIFGEVIPKNFARKHPNRLAVFFTLAIYMFLILFRPVTIFFSIFQKNEAAITANEKQLSSLVKTMHEEGQLELEEGELIQHAMEFDEKIIKEVITPWEEVDYIDIKSTNKQVEEKFILTGYSRLPVMNVEKNKPIGIITFKEFFTSKHKYAFKFKDIISDPVLFSQYDKLSVTMDVLRKERQHLGFVLLNKKSKKIIGIVSLEDLIEEIVGEIYDESDFIEGAFETGHSKWLVMGTISINSFFVKYLNLKPLETDMTISEFVSSKLPKNVKIAEGIKIKWHNLIFQVHEYTKNGQIEFEVIKKAAKSKI